MSDMPENVVQENKDLTDKADEVSGWPSEGEHTPQIDRLNKKDEMVSSVNSYGKLQLPEMLKGQEENFASFKKTGRRTENPRRNGRKTHAVGSGCC